MNCPYMMCLRLTTAEVRGVFGKQVSQFVSSAWATARMLRSLGLAGGAGVRFPAFKFSVGEAREARVGCHLVLGISFGDACSGDVDAEFPGIVFPAESALSISMQISCHVLHGHVCMTY